MSCFLVFLILFHDLLSLLTQHMKKKFTLKALLCFLYHNVLLDCVADVELGSCVSQKVAPPYKIVFSFLDTVMM
jgi:hypothetical protein